LARWQRKARFIIAIFGVVFAVFVARQLKRRELPPPPPPVTRTDPGAITETTGGNLLRFKASREDVSVTFEKQLTYANGTSKLLGVTVVTTEKSGKRSFTITAKEGQLGRDESTIALDGDVRVASSDGTTAATEHASYTSADAIVRAPGPVEYAHGRTRGTGIGMLWNKAEDVLTIIDQAVVHIAADERGAGGADITSGSAAFARRDKYIRFERAVRIQRTNQLTEAETAVAYLTADENNIETLELKENARISSANAAPGALQTLGGTEMNLKYRPNGESLEHVLVTGQAVMQVAGAAGQQGRQITANVIDIALAPDGATPLALLGRDNVQLTLPPESGTPGRTIRAAALDGKGEAGRGLTRAVFSGNVQFRERGGGTDRTATAAQLDVTLKPGLSSIEQARFARTVRFEDGKMTALAAAGLYDLEQGTLALSGTEPAAPVPHVVNDQIAVDATTIDLTLAGPKMKASGNVKSELRPASKGEGGAAGNDVKMPSLLKQDKPVIVLANALDYDGTASTGVYTGAAQLFQGDTSIKGETITIDNKSGNLAASGGVTTTTVLDQVGKDKKKQRAHSVATSKEIKYEDAEHRLTYLNDAHMSGPDGDMNAARIELYLKPSGDELDRAEAFENVTLREQNRETTGTKMIYTTANETYVVTGAPVKIIDECRRETIGRTLTFNKGTDRIVVDGGAQIRTQSRGGNCTS
jgi:LPS export ABC transporter protein LptC/lipopolysaccharide transport protein LptA